MLLCMACCVTPARWQICHAETHICVPGLIGRTSPDLIRPDMLHHNAEAVTHSVCGTQQPDV